MRTAICLLTLGLAAWSQPLVRQQVLSGYHLTAPEAESLEQRLLADESNAETRARLIGYYAQQIRSRRHETPVETRLARRRHLAWLIRNDPASEILGTGDAFAMSGQMEDSANYDALKPLWLEAVERNPDQVPVLRNAALCLQQYNRPLAVTLLQRAYGITAHNDRFVSHALGVQMALLCLGWGNDGTMSCGQVRAELDASRDAFLIGTAGTIIALREEPGGAFRDYARTLLKRAVALSPTDPFAPVWESWIGKMDATTTAPLPRSP